MARKRPAPSPPPPPPPPPQDTSSEEDSSGDEVEEEEARGTPATQNPPQNPKAPSAAAAKDADGDSSHGSDEDQEEDGSSDSDVDAEAFQLRQVARPNIKPQAPASKLVSNAAADEEGESDGDPAESEPDNPEPVKKKKAKKPKAEAEKKRPAPELTPAGKAKKAKAGVEKVAPEPTPSGNAKKAKVGPDKGKGKNPRSESEKAVLDVTPKLQRWTVHDEIVILEAVAGHLKSTGTHPSAVDLLAAVGDSLDRKKTTRSDIYEKVRRLKDRYAANAKKVASTGALPGKEGKEDELRVYKLSEAVWGENAKAVASASASRVDDALSKSKKGQASKEKTDGDTKSRPSKEATTTATPVKTKEAATTAAPVKSKDDTATAAPAKSNKRENHKEELDEAAKNGISKEIITTGPQNGGIVIRSKSEKTDKEKVDGDAERVLPKEAMPTTQNGDVFTKSKYEETQNKEIVGEDNSPGVKYGFDELQNMYPNLACCVEKIKAEHPYGEIMKRVFGSIANEKACTLESKIKKHRVTEFKIEERVSGTRKEVANILFGLLD